ncbi:hypothetical protein HK098_003952 [Nowakowskiella sp. JEL0407]|nr:hypothetical protein HK098_003952 [Nowakowskiella sp. JEL0407]
MADRSDISAPNSCNATCKSTPYTVLTFDGRSYLNTTILNFYGVETCASQSCPVVPQRSFRTNEDYEQYFGKAKAYGCFFGNKNPSTAENWFALYLSGTNTITAGDCPPSCISDANFQYTASTPRRLSNCGSSTSTAIPPDSSPTESTASTPGTLIKAAPTSGNNTIGIAAGVVAGVVVIAAVILGVVLIRRRKSKKKSDSGLIPPPTTSAAALQPLLPIPQADFAYNEQPQSNQQRQIIPELSGFVVVESLGVSNFQNASEQSVLDEYESFRDKIHRLASSAVSANPDASLIPGDVTVTDSDKTSASVAALKSVVSDALHNTIFSHFSPAYATTIAGILWDRRILHQYAGNPEYRVDAFGKMFLEPEHVYSLLLHLIETTNPPDIQKIPDPFIANLVNTCVSQIMPHFTPLATPSNSVAMYKFAVTKIVKEAVVLAIKLKKTDARYGSFIPLRGEKFDSKRMSKINDGERVAFCWGSGWEKVGGEAVVKVLAQVWVV